MMRVIRGYDADKSQQSIPCIMSREGRRPIPIGIKDFKAIRDEDLCYVDKTPLIDFVLSKRGTAVFLFTRPRRFGKSLNLSMMDAYFNERYAGNQWFDGLRISELRPDDPEKNANPVISLSFKDMGRGGPERFKSKFTEKLSIWCRDNIGYFDTDGLCPLDRNTLDDILNMNPRDIESELQNLTRIVHVACGKKPILLIDEYDHPVNGSRGEPWSREMMDLVGGIMSETLKDNDDLKFAIVTGVMQIAKESIFSGTNNVYVNNIFSTDSSEMYGFTPDEVRKLCEEYEHPEKFEEAKDWYDGYRFGGSDIYNPWSVMNYMNSRFVPKPYWVNTSSNDILMDLIRKGDAKILEDLMVLADGKSLRVGLDEAVTFDQISHGDKIYSIMAMTGYINAVASRNGIFEVTIPNLEVRKAYADMVDSAMPSYGNPSLRFIDALERNDCPFIGKMLSDLLMESAGSRMLVNEHVYQALVLGIVLSASDRFDAKADMEGGDGFCDLRMVRRKGDGPSIVVEFKKLGSKASETSLEEACSRALEQISDREYAHGIAGPVMAFGIAFSGKQAKAMSEMLPNRACPMRCSWPEASCRDDHDSVVSDMEESGSDQHREERGSEGDLPLQSQKTPCSSVLVPVQPDLERPPSPVGKLDHDVDL